MHNLDGKGYAFAYDDVQLDGGEDQSGKVNAGDPEVFTVTVGGKSAVAVARRAPQPPISQRGGYDRPAPPPPPTKEEGGAGWKGKMQGLARKVMK